MHKEKHLQQTKTFWSGLYIARSSAAISSGLLPCKVESTSNSFKLGLKPPFSLGNYGFISRANNCVTARETVIHSLQRSQNVNAGRDTETLDLGTMMGCGYFHMNQTQTWATIVSVRCLCVTRTIKLMLLPQNFCWQVDTHKNGLWWRIQMPLL